MTWLDDDFYEEDMDTILYNEIYYNLVKSKEEELQRQLTEEEEIELQNIAYDNI